MTTKAKEATAGAQGDSGSSGASSDVNPAPDAPANHSLEGKTCINDDNPAVYVSDGVAVEQAYFCAACKPVNAPKSADPAPE